MPLRQTSRGIDHGNRAQWLDGIGQIEIGVYEEIERFVGYVGQGA